MRLRDEYLYTSALTAAIRGLTTNIKVSSNPREIAEFYLAAQRTGVHSFIEFTGLQHEFIMLCKRALELGQDFTQTNVHSGKTLPAKAYHAAYVAEKLGCIYGTTFSAPDLRKIFIMGLFGHTP